MLQAMCVNAHMNMVIQPMNMKTYAKFLIPVFFVHYFAGSFINDFSASSVVILQ